MAHGAPDFGMYAPKITVGSLADMGELAARLNSIVTLDRRGDVVFMDDFEAPVAQWDLGGLGVGAVYDLYPGEAFMGSQCLRLGSGNSTDDYAVAIRRFHITPNQRYGIEARIRGLTVEADYHVEIYVFDGTNYHAGVWKYNAEDDELTILDSTGADKVIATGIAAAFIYDEWWPMKLVIDSKTLKYVRGLFLGVEYDLSAESLRAELDASPICIQVELEVTTLADAIAGSQWDNFILTQNEP